MRVTVLASGSAGNAVLVEADGTRVLVDAGMSPRELSRRFDRAAAAVRLDDVEAVCVTHEHNDHAGGVAALASAGLAVHATEGTARALGLAGTLGLAAGERTRVGALEVLPVAIPHDAAEPVGFVLRDEHGSVGVLTDCGHAAADVARAFSGCDLLIVEANYDDMLLRTGPYPASVKRRVSGPRGHLSNEQAAALLGLMRQPPQVVVLAHLSVENNRPRLARQAVELVTLRMPRRPRLVVAAQDKATSPIVLARGQASVLPGADDRQLRLAFPDG